MSARAQVLALTALRCTTKRSARRRDVAAVCIPWVAVINIAWSLCFAIRRATIAVEVVAVIAVLSRFELAISANAGALLRIELTYAVCV